MASNSVRVMSTILNILNSQIIHANIHVISWHPHRVSHHLISSVTAPEDRRTAGHPLPHPVWTFVKFRSGFRLIQNCTKGPWHSHPYLVLGDFPCGEVDWVWGSKVEAGDGWGRLHGQRLGESDVHFICLQQPPHDLFLRVVWLAGVPRGWPDSLWGDSGSITIIINIIEWASVETASPPP